MTAKTAKKRKGMTFLAPLYVLCGLLLQVGRRGFLKVVHNSSNTVLDLFHIEVDEKSKFTARQFQVRQNLRQVNVRQGVNRFYFNYDFVLNQQIDSVAAFKLHVLIHKRERFLNIDLQA